MCFFQELSKPRQTFPSRQYDKVAGWLGRSFRLLWSWSAKAVAPDKIQVKRGYAEVAM